MKKNILKEKKINIDLIDLIVFDFDGVFTDNNVILNEDGKEHVVCSRSDGLAIEVLRNLYPDLKLIILSSEKNRIVKARGKKLKIDVYQNVCYKEEALKTFVKDKSIELSRTLYVGNDVNDYNAMILCQYSVCPFDSDYRIKKIVDIVLSSKGGKGVIRELIEKVFGINMLDYYIK